MRSHRARIGLGRLTFTFRGTGPSEGDFSIEGWLADVRAAVDALHARTDITGVWIAGFRLGGTLAIVIAADDDRVRGIATFAAPASLRDVGARARVVPRVRAPHRRVAHTRVTRPIPTRGSARSRTSIRSRPRRASRRGRGCSCTAAPTTSSRSTTRAGSPTRGGDSVDLRIVANGPHRLRHDPRAIAALLGWLDRQEP